MHPNAVPPSPEELQAYILGKCDPERACRSKRTWRTAPIVRAFSRPLPTTTCCAVCRGAGELPRVDAHLAPATIASLAGPAAAAEDTTNLGEPAKSAELGAEAAGLMDHPRYRLIRKLGQGGMGTVYLAEHRLMRRQVAIKLIRSRYLGNPQFVERFRREMQAAASLSHPHIVTAHDAEEAAGNHFLVMEFVEGEPLDRWLAQQGPLPAAEACGYIRQAALGLQLAHEQGMVHRDIKPHNLMRTTAGTVKILDFGLARVLRESAVASGEHITAEGTVMGTADYMAPEQGRDSHRADIRADIYSLGCRPLSSAGGQRALSARHDSRQDSQALRRPSRTDEQPSAGRAGGTGARHRQDDGQETGGPLSNAGGGCRGAGSLCPDVLRQTRGARSRF